MELTQHCGSLVTHAKVTNLNKSNGLQMTLEVSFDLWLSSAACHDQKQVVTLFH